MTAVIRNIVLIILVSIFTETFIQADRSPGSMADTLVIDSLRLKGLNLSSSYPDSSRAFIEQSLSMCAIINDNLRTAKGLNCLGITYYIQTEYEKSFDLFSRALKRLEGSSAYDVISAVHNNQGNIYECIRLYDMAEKSYLKALEFLEQTNSSDKNKFLINTVSNLGLIYMYLGKYAESLTYYQKAYEILQTADMEEKKKIFRHAKLQMDMGIVHLLMQDVAKAEALFQKYGPIVESWNEILPKARWFYYMGRLLMEKGEYSRAEKYLEKSNDLAASLNNMQLKIDVLISLSLVNQQTNSPLKALAYLKEKDSLKDQMLNVENTWRIHNLQQEYETEEQRQEFELALKEQKLSKLTKALYLLIVIVLIIFGGLYIRRLVAKHKEEKKLAEMELSKSKEILKVKNKELTTSTLKIMENEELMKQFKSNLEEVKKDGDPHYQKKLDRLAHSLDSGSKMNWEEFKLRFEQVYDDFYKKLKESYPSLTPTELKLCSFLKLNFSSKDIAVLMGISDKSVKMNRYRLRKKFNITRKQNLVEFIAQF